MSKNVKFTNDASQLPGQIWWREAYMWLVVGGPVIVVIAAIATAVIAFTNPDPVLDPRNISQSRFMEQSRLAQMAKDNLISLQPAMLGRNNAASPLPLEPVGIK